MGNIRHISKDNSHIRKYLSLLLFLLTLICLFTTSCDFSEAFAPSQAPTPTYVPPSPIVTPPPTPASTAPAPSSVPPPPVAPLPSMPAPSSVIPPATTPAPSTPTPPHTQTPNIITNRQSIDISKLEQQIHSLINYVRTSAGLQPLAWNDTLNKIARNHSLDMAVRNYFSHTSPEGYDILDRYLIGGFSTNTACAENIFQCSRIKYQWYINGIPSSTEYYTQDEIALLTVKSWLESAGHRENILTPDWRLEGIGIAISSRGEIYITQNFG